jgi:hypothetical protein
MNSTGKKPTKNSYLEGYQDLRKMCKALQDEHRQ